MSVLGLALWSTSWIWRREEEASNDYWAFGFSHLGTWATGTTRERDARVVREKQFSVQF